MGKYKVLFSERAAKDINVLSDANFNLIINKCKRLEDNPVPDGKHIKKLKGYKKLYRLRAGEYRIVFEWKDIEVNVVRILTRQDFGKKY